MEVDSSAATRSEVESSRFLSVLELGSTAAIADGMRGQRHVVPVGVARALDHLRAGGFWETAIAEHAPDVDSVRWQRFLIEQGYLHGRGVPADESVSALLSELSPLTFPTGRSQGRKVKALYLSHCAASWFGRMLGMKAYMRGMPITVSSTTHNDRALIDEIQPDFVIVEPFDLTVAARFWNSGARATDDERLQLIETLKSYLSGVIDDLKPRATGRLILLRGITAPVLRPDGRTEFRRAVSMDSMARAVNDHVAERLRAEPNMMFIDEQHLLSSRGISEMMPMNGPYGNIFSVSWGLATRLVSVLCEEYLDAYTLWSATAPLKCVVVDLDNTLWPGVVGEGGGIPVDDMDARINVAQSAFGGIHQALEILKQRGILLATCSRNNREEVLGSWSAMPQDRGLEPFLLPSDFALHEISWDPKPVAMKRILVRLGLDPAHVVFVDDDPLQREHMRQSFPQMKILGENLNIVRAQLLTDPRLQVNVLTDDARARTDTTRASLARTAAASEWAGSSSIDFLRTLNLELQVRRLCSSRELPRVAELLKRTNQFNLTGLRPDVGELRRFVDSSGADVFTLNVRDRFGDHGLVGVCLLRNNRIENVAVSCRVMSLEVALPFLSAVLASSGLWRETLHGHIVLTDRNVPCRNLLREAGFDEVEPQQYVRRANRECPLVDSGIYKVSVEDEQEELPAGDARPEAAA